MKVLFLVGIFLLSLNLSSAQDLCNAEECFLLTYWTGKYADGRPYRGKNFNTQKFACDTNTGPGTGVPCACTEKVPKAEPPTESPSGRPIPGVTWTGPNRTYVEPDCRGVYAERKTGTAPCSNKVNSGIYRILGFSSMQSPPNSFRPPRFYKPDSDASGFLPSLYRSR